MIVFCGLQTVCGDKSDWRRLSSHNSNHVFTVGSKQKDMFQGSLTSNKAKMCMSMCYVLKCNIEITYEQVHFISCIIRKLLGNCNAVR